MARSLFIAPDKNTQVNSSQVNPSLPGLTRQSMAATSASLTLPPLDARTKAGHNGVAKINPAP